MSTTDTTTGLCRDCGLPMSTAQGCTDPPRSTTPYGDEAWYDLDVELPERCRDCGCLLGHRHHAFCCVAECALCGGQALTCTDEQEHS